MAGCQRFLVCGCGLKHITTSNSIYIFLYIISLLLFRYLYCVIQYVAVNFYISDVLIIVSGPTPNKALLKELVAPPGDFSLMVPVCSLVI